MIKKILIALVIILVAIQFVPIDLKNPAVQEGEDFFAVNEATPEVKQMIKSSCYDCHSNETKYPYYFKIAPVNFWLKHHIDEGREHLNFSEWTRYSTEKRNHKLDECAEEITEGKMPMDSYTWLHNSSKLSDEQKQTLIEFFNQTK